MSEKLIQCGKLTGHKGWVTSIATPADPSANFIVSGSRDKTAMVWELTNDSVNVGFAKRSLNGHSHFVQDVALSRDGQFALTASWDNEMRLWRIDTAESVRRFVGHKKDVMSVSFSPENRQIVSCSRDKTIKVWNTIGECKLTFDQNSHSDWVTCCRFSPSTENPVIVSVGSDKRVNVWSLNKTVPEQTFTGHTGYLNKVEISPDGSICASAGKDGIIMLWNLAEKQPLSSFDAGSEVHALAFSPNRFWLCVALDSCIKIYDLENRVVVDQLVAESSGNSRKIPRCLSLAWSADGNKLFAGYDDNDIRVWQVVPTQFGSA